MKIFNWVHRKFHNKDESSENVKIMKAEHGTGALLEQVALGDVNVDDWSQGILAIGTFGYNDPSPVGFNQQVQFHSFGNEELENLEKEGPKKEGASVETKTSDVEGGDHNLLVLNASKDGVSNKDIVCHQDQNASESEITILAVDNLENVQCEFYEKKERITLADLFLADSDEYVPHTELDDKDQGDVLKDPKSMRKADGTVSSKLKLPFAKKFIPPTKQDYSNSTSHSRGIKKIHKMMTRMLKKKIHPEHESKKQIKKENKIKYGGDGVIEMASLLETEDAIVCP